MSVRSAPFSLIETGGGKAMKMTSVVVMPPEKDLKKRLVAATVSDTRQSLHCCHGSMVAACRTIRNGSNFEGVFTMTAPDSRDFNQLPEHDDVQGYRINLNPLRPAPPDATGGLYPYQFLHPTISNGYIFYPSGNVLPYP
jgi:hypothetical protein